MIVPEGSERKLMELSQSEPFKMRMEGIAVYLNFHRRSLSERGRATLI